MADPLALQFFQRAVTDPALRAEIHGVRVDDNAFKELAKIAQRAGYPITAEAIATGLRECGSRALNDSDLEAVSGGTGTSNTASPTTITGEGSTFGKFLPSLNISSQ